MELFRAPRSESQVLSDLVARISVLDNVGGGEREVVCRGASPRWKWVSIEIVGKGRGEGVRSTPLLPSYVDGQL